MKIKDDGESKSESPDLEIEKKSTDIDDNPTSIDDLPDEILKLFDEKTRIQLMVAERKAREASKTPLRRSAPGEFAHADQQGPFWTCTLHAISKAIVDGCMRAVFWREVGSIDLIQDEVTKELLRRYEHQMVDKGKWPQMMSNQNFDFVDQKTNKRWYLRLFVTPVKKQLFINDKLKKSSNNNTHIFVYLNDNKTSHCVYVSGLTPDDDDESEYIVKCINSSLTTKMIYRSVNDKGNLFYRVFCEVKDTPIIDDQGTKIENAEEAYVTEDSEDDHEKTSKGKFESAESINNLETEVANIISSEDEEEDYKPTIAEQGTFERLRNFFVEKIRTKEIDFSSSEELFYLQSRLKQVILH